MTISIAAYNVEKYIENTLKSVLVEKVLDDIEVIVVNDGSTDKTYEIAKNYEERYKGTVKVIDKENGGYGSTVNCSINIARGKYFKLLDGDDWYDRDALTKFIFTLKNINTDMVVTNFRKVHNDSETLGLSFDKYIENEDLNTCDIKINEGIPMHAITYKTEILKESKVMLKEKLLYTDNYFVSIPLVKVKSVRFIDLVLYNYRLGLEGQSLNRNVNIKHISDLEEISYDLVNYFEKVDKKEIVAYDYLMTRIASTCADYIVASLMLPVSFTSLKRIIGFEHTISNVS